MRALSYIQQMIASKQVKLHDEGMLSEIGEDMSAMEQSVEAYKLQDPLVVCDMSVQVSHEVMIKEVDFAVHECNVMSHEEHKEHEECKANLSGKADDCYDQKLPNFETAKIEPDS